MTFNNCDIRFPSQVYWGAGSINNLSSIVAQTKVCNIVLLTDAVMIGSGVVDPIIAALKQTGKALIINSTLATEPSYGDFKALCKQLQEAQIDCIVGVGGGSVMDQAKLLAVAITNPQFVDYIKDTSYIVNPPVKMVAIPTTSGTGAEATANAILFFPEEELKVGIVHPSLIPSYVILDPNMLQCLPKRLVASTGIDALCHALESLISKKNNCLCELYALRSIDYISKYLKCMYDDIADEEARSGMLLASFYAGICLTTSSTVGVHALSYPLGGKYHIPHGLANAILLPFVMEYNHSACATIFGSLAKHIGITNDSNDSQAFVQWLFDLTEYLDIPRDLTTLGVGADQLPFLAQQALKVERLIHQNPRTMTVEDIEAIYSRVLVQHV